MSESLRPTFGRALRAPGPVELVDQAVFVARALSPRRLLRAWLAALLPSLALIAIYVVERVEGVRSARPLLACLIVAALFGRVALLRSVSRACAEALGHRCGVGASVTDLLRLASIVLFGWWCWAWLLVGVAKLSPFALPFVLPLLALRSLGAPSWLARAACGDGAAGGWSAYRIAFRDVDGVRGAFMVADLLGVVGAIGLFINLFALLGVALLVGHSMLGLDVAFTSAFMSPDNTFVLLLVGSATFVLLEPFRVALSAIAFVGGLSRRDGGDLDRAIEQVIADQTSRSRHVAARSAVGLMLVASLLGASVSFAQANEEEIIAAVVPERDQEVVAQANAILTRPEFAELADTDKSSLAQLVERWLRQLKDYLDGDSDAQAHLPEYSIPSPSPWVVLTVGLVLLSIVAAYVYRQRGRERAAVDASDDTVSLRIDPSVEPNRLLEGADSLAARGEFAAALRALYVASIVSLHRRGLITFSQSTTNWQYQRQLPPGAMRGTFGDLTRVFDLKHYGDEATSPDEYQACRGLAQRLCGDQVVSMNVIGERPL